MNFFSSVTARRKKAAHAAQTATLNVQGLATADRLIELQHALHSIKVDIIALTELRWRGIGSLELTDSEYRFYFAGPKDSKGTSGTGFFVSRRFLKQAQVLRFEQICERISVLDVSLGQKTLRLFAAYAPPKTGKDDKDQDAYDQFLTNLAQPLLCDLSGRTLPLQGVYRAVLGDFNAKVGCQETNERSMGRHGFGHRNNRGEELVNFCEKHHLRIFNSYFKKRPGRKWTWRSNDHHTKNEIDYFIGQQDYTV
uniref:Endonuclease/exonuclease/phosphatase domain-containing protein n=1 Tax=Plectus sambesii TaxID=2011161 RepID=A0A914V0E9_9BILA